MLRSELSSCSSSIVTVPWLPDTVQDVTATVFWLRISRHGLHSLVHTAVFWWMVVALSFHSSTSTTTAWLYWWEDDIMKEGSYIVLWTPQRALLWWGFLSSNRLVDMDALCCFSSCRCQSIAGEYVRLLVYDVSIYVPLNWIFGTFCLGFGLRNSHVVVRGSLLFWVGYASVDLCAASMFMYFVVSIVLRLQLTWPLLYPELGFQVRHTSTLSDGGPSFVFSDAIMVRGFVRRWWAWRMRLLTSTTEATTLSRIGFAALEFGFDDANKSLQRRKQSRENSSKQWVANTVGTSVVTTKKPWILNFGELILVRF